MDDYTHVKNLIVLIYLDASVTLKFLSVPISASRFDRSFLCHRTRSLDTPLGQVTRLFQDFQAGFSPHPCRISPAIEGELRQDLFVAITGPPDKSTRSLRSTAPPVTSKSS